MTHPGRDVAERVGRVGVWTFQFDSMPVAEVQRAAARIDAGPLLAVEQAISFETDAAKARELARSYMGHSLRLDNYASNLRRLGWSDDAIAGPSDALVDAIVAWGPIERIVDRVVAHLRTGAGHVCVQPLGADPLRMDFGRIGELLRGAL